MEFVLINLGRSFEYLEERSFLLSDQVVAMVFACQDSSPMLNYFIWKVETHFSGRSAAALLLLSHQISCGPMTRPVVILSAGTSMEMKSEFNFSSYQKT